MRGAVGQRARPSHWASTLPCCGSVAKPWHSWHRGEQLELSTEVWARQSQAREQGAEKVLCPRGASKENVLHREKWGLLPGNNKAVWGGLH